MDKQIIDKLNSIDFLCQRCSNCCRHDPGHVFLTEKDAKNIAAQLSLSLDDFIKQCCRLIDRDDHYIIALKEKQNFDCLFWNDGCIVYDVRPVQCRTFPYWPFIVESKEFLEIEKKRCKGIGIKGTQTLDEKIELNQYEKNSIYYSIKKDNTSR